MTYSYEVAKTVLNENDKNRLLCLFLNCDPQSINWDKATREFGAASIDSMRVMYRSVLKKIESAGGKEGVDPKTIAPSPARKRKAAAAETGNNDEDASAPPKKKRGRKPKKELTPVVEDTEIEEEDEMVKKEEVCDEE